MSQAPHHSWKPTRGFLFALVVVFVVVPVVIFLGTSTGEPYQRKKTHTIINSIRLGLELATAGKASMIRVDFPTVLDHFTGLSVLEDLQALRAIDHGRQCFVDGWGHPIHISTANHVYVIIAPGPDGVLGTGDDLR
jgi:hypothetical protein